MTKNESALEIRSIPSIWPGSTIAILGGGSSINEMNLTPVWKFRTIGVNHSFRLGPVDMLWFGDYDIFVDNENDIANFAGLKCTCNTRMPEMPWPGIKRVRRSDNNFGIESERTDMVRWNNNSGASAINVAYHLGAERVLLIGFDMRTVNGKSHFHNRYPSTTRDPYARHLQCFPQIARDAEALGLEIINCTIGSAIKEFPIVNIGDI